MLRSGTCSNGDGNDIDEGGGAASDGGGDGDGHYLMLATEGYIIEVVALPPLRKSDF